MVELVLVMPLLMMMAAFLVLVGSTGSWRVRTHANARQAALRAVWPRSTFRDRTPADWPAGSTTLSSSSVPTNLLPLDPYAEHSAVRGPSYVPMQGEGSLPVEGAITSPLAGVLNGQASIDRPPAIWPRSGFRTRMTRDFHVLENELGYNATPMRYGANHARRGRELFGIRFN